MVERQSDKVSLEQMLRWLDQLSDSDQETLRRKLEGMRWSRALDQLADLDIGQSAAKAWQGFTQRVESGELDEEVRAASAKTVESVLKSVVSLCEAVTGTKSQRTASGGSEDPEVALEELYQDLQSNLISVRQAVAQAIATEKQLELQVEKSRQQADTWLSRAAMAVQKRNQELADQASARRRQYVDSTDSLEEQLLAQRDATSKLRQRLTDVEGDVQRAYTKKQVLIARHKAAQAALQAREILKHFTTDDTLSAFAKMEKRVADCEGQAGLEQMPTREQPPPDSNELLLQALVTLERAMAVIDRLEKSHGDSSSPGN